MCASVTIDSSITLNVAKIKWNSRLCFTFIHTFLGLRIQCCIEALINLCKADLLILINSLLLILPSHNIQHELKEFDYSQAFHLELDLLTKENKIWTPAVSIHIALILRVNTKYLCLLSIIPMSATQNIKRLMDRLKKPLLPLIIINYSKKKKRLMREIIYISRLFIQKQKNSFCVCFNLSSYSSHSIWYLDGIANTTVRYAYYMHHIH